MVDAPDRVHLDLTAPVVRHHRCQAYRELVLTYTEANDLAAAARARTRGMSACADEGGIERP